MTCDSNQMDKSGFKLLLLPHLLINESDMSTTLAKRNTRDADGPTVPSVASDMPPKKKRRVSELVKSLEKSRRNEKRVFQKLIRRARQVYGDISKFTAGFIAEQSLPETSKTFQTLFAELEPFMEHLKWREQARGPTSMLSAKVDGLENFKQWDNHPIWVLCTPRTERTIETHGRTLNYAENNFMTWGLPAVDKFERRVFKQYRLVFVIEKLKGGEHVQHRIKNLYMCLTKARKHDDRLYLVTWKYFMERVLAGEKVKTPSWCRREATI